ncbi:hypothetical protein AAA088_06985 [Hominifimenecus microfluidus]
MRKRSNLYKRTSSESRTVRAGREAAGEWTSEGGLNGVLPSRDRRESHPLSMGHV